jgi:hypothetical protein
MLLVAKNTAIASLRRFVLALIGAWMSCAAGSGEAPAQGSVSIEIDAGRLTVEARAAPLDEVIRRMGEQAGFDVVTIGDHAEYPSITISFSNLPVPEAVAAVVGDANHMIYYAAVRGAAERGTLSQVWLLGPSGAPDVGGARGDEDIAVTGNVDHAEMKRLNDAVLRVANQGDAGTDVDRAQLLSGLERALGEAPEPLLRARAAVAMGTLRDPGAVPALEAALRDGHASVRAQAINALGQIGGEAATAVLGGVLLYGSADRAERVLAARALWKQNSEAARAYLASGAHDADEKVRRVSSKAPKSSPRTLIIPGRAEQVE